ncbi:MAG: hypothetical protein FJ399_03330 [Verrucomicrobia bacterium]|nr:hypothetical protein [Verrucomicrobiota bacterium]
MRTSTHNSSRKSVPAPKAHKNGSGSTLTLTTKLRKKWQFAPDAIGMFSGPRDLSQRKGLSA